MIIHPKEICYCPNCNASLNTQPDFDPNYSTWTCKKCGQLLFGDNIYAGEAYPGVIWYCDCCEALMNEQPGFSDLRRAWRCTKCGYKNPINGKVIFKPGKNPKRYC